MNILKSIADKLPAMFKSVSDRRPIQSRMPTLSQAELQRIVAEALG
jgi:hypothetical protein